MPSPHIEPDHLPPATRTGRRSGTSGLALDNRARLEHERNIIVPPTAAAAATCATAAVAAPPPPLPPPPMCDTAPKGAQACGGAAGMARNNSKQTEPVVEAPQIQEGGGMPMESMIPPGRPMRGHRWVFTPENGSVPCDQCHLALPADQMTLSSTC
jgi:hypothetical protein